MQGKARNSHWSSVDSLWNAFEADHELLFIKKQNWKLSDRSEADAWATVNDFWNSYAEQQQDDIVELQDMMADLRETWANGASAFDEDPLLTNSGPKSQYQGPLQTTANEEDWSQWLAHLLRTSSGAFPHQILRTSNRSPTRVRREVVFFSNNSQRRVDILVEYEDIGVSIEVKQGDENYGKTPEAASLIEQNDHRDWSHVLLIQKEKLPRLQQTFGHELDQSEKGPPTIRSDQSADIDVRYWRDVSRILRRILLNGCESNNHWEASAYIFITLIEQRVLGFQSFSFLNSATAFRTGVHRLVAAEPNLQIDYLRSILHENHNHE